MSFRPNGDDVQHILSELSFTSLPEPRYPEAGVYQFRDIYTAFATPYNRRSISLNLFSLYGKPLLIVFRKYMNVANVSLRYMPNNLQD